jgi:Stress responsive A/B Barrel Domain
MNMKGTSRRKFITDSAKAAAGVGFISITSNSEFAMTASKNLFVHHVYFWLNNANSSEDLTKLLEGLEKLSKVKTIKMFHIGKPAGTNRDVIDGSYSVSWLLLFNNRADQDSYQTDPVHLKFIDECKHLWKKVVVYDSIDA